MFIVDMSELRRLEASFARSERVVGPEVVKVVKKGAQNLKEGWAARAEGIGHAPHYPRAITYDLVLWGVGARAEVGPDKDRLQGALGNILEYGTSKNAPRPDGAAALQEEEPKFLDALGAAAGNVLGDL